MIELRDETIILVVGSWDILVAIFPAQSTCWHIINVTRSIIDWIADVSSLSKIILPSCIRISSYDNCSSRSVFWQRSRLLPYLEMDVDTIEWIEDLSAFRKSFVHARLSAWTGTQRRCAPILILLSVWAFWWHFGHDFPHSSSALSRHRTSFTGTLCRCSPALLISCLDHLSLPFPTYACKLRHSGLNYSNTPIPTNTNIVVVTAGKILLERMLAWLTFVPTRNLSCWPWSRDLPAVPSIVLLPSRSAMSCVRPTYAANTALNFA